MHSRLGGDAGRSPLQEGGSPSSYSPPIDMQLRKLEISAVPGSKRAVPLLAYRSGNHHMAAGGHNWTRGDQDAFV